MCVLISVSLGASGVVGQGLRSALRRCLARTVIAGQANEFQVPVIDTRDGSKLIISVPGLDLDDAKRNALAAGWGLQDEAPPPADTQTKRSVLDHLAGDDPTERAVFFGTLRSAAVILGVLILLGLIFWGLVYLAGADDRQRASAREFNRLQRELESLGGG